MIENGAIEKLLRLIYSVEYPEVLFQTSSTLPGAFTTFLCLTYSARRQADFSTDSSLQLNELEGVVKTWIDYVNPKMQMIPLDYQSKNAISKYNIEPNFINI